MLDDADRAEHSTKIAQLRVHGARGGRAWWRARGGTGKAFFVESDGYSSRVVNHTITYHRSDLGTGIRLLLYCSTHVRFPIFRDYP